MMMKNRRECLRRRILLLLDELSDFQVNQKTMFLSYPNRKRLIQLSKKKKKKGDRRVKKKLSDSSEVERGKRVGRSLTKYRSRMHRLSTVSKQVNRVHNLFSLRPDDQYFKATREGKHTR